MTVKDTTKWRVDVMLADMDEEIAGPTTGYFVSEGRRMPKLGSYILLQNYIGKAPPEDVQLRGRALITKLEKEESGPWRAEFGVIGPIYICCN